LDVLQSEVLCVAAAMHLELRLVAGNEGKDVSNGGNKGVHVQVDVVAVNREFDQISERGRYNATFTHLPTASARSLARFLVAGLEFSVPM
jgi:hypothetical protein